jgi:anti-sigma factor ChrR (cupin superfamily)
MIKLDPNLRLHHSTNQANFVPYNRYGTPVDGMNWLPLSGELLNGAYECFMLQMEPGTHSRPHEHMGHEEFLVLEGHLIDLDGVEYKKGDFVHLLPGSKHSSHTIEGCLLMVILRGSNRPLSDNEM